MPNGCFPSIASSGQDRTPQPGQVTSQIALCVQDDACRSSVMASSVKPHLQGIIRRHAARRLLRRPSRFPDQGMNRVDRISNMRSEVRS